MFLVSVIWTLPRRLSSDHPLRLGNIDANSTVIHSSREKHHRNQRSGQCQPNFTYVTETKRAPMVRDFLRHQCIERDGGSFGLRITKLAVQPST
jgi:hypothetical protein